MKQSTKIVLSYVIGIPVALIGVLCVLSIVLAPVGLVLVGLAAYPLYRTLSGGSDLVEKPTAAKPAAPEPWGDGPEPWFVLYEKETSVD